MSNFVFETIGLAYRQNPEAPELFAFVSSANLIRKMTGVARKSDKLLTNYQRALDLNRVKNEVTPFFKIASNSSPTAIVLSIHEAPNVTISFEKIGGFANDLIDLRRLTITMADLDSLSAEEIIKASIIFLKDRLSKNSSDEELSTDEELVKDDFNSEEDDEDISSSDSVDLGESMLKELLLKLEKGEDKSEDFIEVLRDMLKPSLVIDGQHRLFGAAALEEDIPMLVCALIKPDWKEQVFQFTVINDKSVGIPKSFITSLAGMSLTPDELKALTTRLAQAGVQLWEVEVMQRMGYDPESAFYQKINFNVAGEGKGLGYQTMKKVGKAWHDAKNKGLLSIVRIIHQNPLEKKLNQKELIKLWQSEKLWFKYFNLFWGSVRAKFTGTEIWELHSPFMLAVVLEQFQLSFLEELETVAPITIAKITSENNEDRRKKVDLEYQTIVKNFVDRFEIRHFSKPWAQKSLNHKDGKKLISDYIENVKKGYSVSNHQLFKK
jgi:hypothetical protein